MQDVNLSTHKERLLHPCLFVVDVFIVLRVSGGSGCDSGGVVMVVDADRKRETDRHRETERKTKGQTHRGEKESLFVCV